MAILRFDEFELDTDTPTLKRRGRPTHAQDLPLRLLILLASQPGQLLTREALFEQFWPQDQTGILDDNLNTLVRKLRALLNDDARNPRFIATVPRRGYRFIAPVMTDDTAAQPAPDDTTSATQPAQRMTGALGTIAFAALCAVVAALLWQYFPDNRANQSITVAVLPFNNAQGSNTRDYFSDGLAEDILDRLSGFQGLRVVSRTSSFSAGGTQLDAKAIGQLLGASTLVEGSVRRNQNRVTINVRLIETTNGFQTWSRQYKRQLSDLSAVQEQVALEIASALADEITPRQPAASETVAIEPAAYDAYLKGRFFWHKRSEQDLKMAAELFEQAIELAPDYAPAWAGLADALAVLGFYDYLPPKEAFTRAKGAATRALQLDPKSASAEANLGYVTLYYDWDFEQAEAHFRQSIELSPDYSKAHQWYANLLVAAGRFDEAEREMRIASQLDPLSLIANAALGWVQYHAGRTDDALAQFRLTQELDPGFELLYLWSGLTRESRKEYARAIEDLNRAVTLSSRSAISVAALARVHALAGNHSESQALLSELQQGDGYLPAYEIAKAYFAQGRTPDALRWLERAYTERSHSMVFIRVDPQLSDSRQSGEFKALVARVFDAE